MNKQSLQDALRKAFNMGQMYNCYQVALDTDGANQEEKEFKEMVEEFCEELEE